MSTVQCRTVEAHHLIHCFLGLGYTQDIRYFWGEYPRVVKPPKLPPSKWCEKLPYSFSGCFRPISSLLATASSKFHTWKEVFQHSKSQVVPFYSKTKARTLFSTLTTTTHTFPGSQTIYFIAWSTNHHFYSKGLSSFKFGTTILKNGGFTSSAECIDIMYLEPFDDLCFSFGFGLCFGEWKTTKKEDKLTRSSSHLKIGLLPQKETSILVFQPSIFRGKGILQSHEKFQLNSTHQNGRKTVRLTHAPQRVLWCACNWRSWRHVVHTTMHQHLGQAAPEIQNSKQPLHCSPVWWVKKVGKCLEIQMEISLM